MIELRKMRSILSGAALILSSFLTFAGGNHETEEFNVTETIMHHIKDAHEWHIAEVNGKHITFYLPIILVDNGVKFFSSEVFYHGEEKTYTDHEGNTISYIAGTGKGEGYAMFHEKIYKLDENNELAFEHDHPTNAKPWDFSMTRNVIATLLGALVVLLLVIPTANFFRKNGAVAPKGMAKFVEPLILHVRDDIAKANIDEHKYKKYVPFLLTLFFFIWVNNMIGLIPVMGSNLTGSISLTFVLAVLALLATLFSANKNYWKHIFATPGVPIPLLIIMVPIEIIGIFTKPFSLMVRLFANITAGHIIIIALVSIIFINKNIGWAGLSVPMALFISVLELLVAYLQAYLFTMLTALYIGGAVEEAHH